MSNIRKNNIKCINCGKAVDETAIKDKYKNYWCKTCAEKYLQHCDKCNSLCEKDTLEHTENGNKYCEDCITYCVHCDKAIPIDEAIDAIQQGQHDTWCPDCAEKYLVKCDGCEMMYPTNEVKKINGSFYCNNCQKIIEFETNDKY